MPLQFNPFTGTFDVTTKGDTGTVSAAGDGTAAAPGITFASDTNTGIYRPGEDQLALSTNGTQRVLVQNVSQNTVRVSGTNAAVIADSTFGVYPGFRLAVNGSLLGGFDGESGISATLSTYGAQSLIFGTNSTERARITSTGLVGIGTSSPQVNLDVRGIINAGNGTTRWGLIGTDADGAYLGTAGINHPWIFKVGNGSADVERMRLTSTGLGIGTNAPNRRLEISDSNADNFIRINTSGAFKSGIEFSNSGTAFGQLYFTNVAPYDLSLLQQYTTGSLILGTNNTERARIDSSGRLGIGTTTPQSLASVGLGSSVDNGLSLIFTGDNSVKAKFYANTSSGAVSIGGSASGYFPVFLSNNSEAARIDTSGRLLVGTSSNSGGALLQVNGDRIRVATAKTPASATDTGTAGEICWDANYIYVCTATNTWKRTAIATW